MAKFNNAFNPTNKKLKEMDLNAMYKAHDKEVRRTDNRRSSAQPLSQNMNRQFNNTQQLKGSRNPVKSTFEIYNALPETSSYIAINMGSKGSRTMLSSA